YVHIKRNGCFITTKSVKITIPTGQNSPKYGPSRLNPRNLLLTFRYLACQPVTEPGCQFFPTAGARDNQTVDRARVQPWLLPVPALYAPVSRYLALSAPSARPAWPVRTGPDHSGPAGHGRGPCRDRRARRNASRHR